MKAGCAAQKLQFEAHGKRDVVADFDGGRMTSDGGGLLLREANCCLGDLMARLGQCVSDFRQQGSVEHTATDLIAQRVCALALGYEDLNDHGTLRRDSLLALLAGRKDLTGQGRKRKRDRAAPPGPAAPPLRRPTPGLPLVAPPAPASTASLLTSPSPSAIMVLPSLEQPHLPHTEVSTKP